MEYKTIDHKVFVRLDPGEEIVSCLQQLVSQLEIRLGTITGIGATNNITLGLYNTQKKTYQQHTFTGDHEIAPLYGNITQMHGKPYLHLHINICDEQNRSYCGHLNKAEISVTFEGVIDVMEGSIERKKDTVTGLNILSI